MFFANTSLFVVSKLYRWVEAGKPPYKDTQMTMLQATSVEHQEKQLSGLRKEKAGQIRLVFALLKRAEPMTLYQYLGRNMGAISSGIFKLPENHSSDDSGWKLADAIDEKLVRELRDCLKRCAFFGITADTSVLVGNVDYLDLEVVTCVDGVRKVFFVGLGEVGQRTNAEGYLEIVIDMLKDIAGAETRRRLFSYVHFFFCTQ